MDSDPMRRLNWGCGPVPVPGWYNSDVDVATVTYPQEADMRAPLLHVGDILEGLPWPDDFFDGAVAHHSLNCLTYAEIEPALVALRSVIRPDGWLRITVPDVVAAFVAWENGQAGWPGFVAITEPWGFDRKFGHYLTWGGSVRTTFLATTLGDALVSAGFDRVNTCGTWRSADPDDREVPPWLLELDSRLGESIVALARVPR